MAKASSESFAGNLGRLGPLLANLRTDGIGHAIDGKRVDGNATFDTISPVDKSLIATIARGTAADVDRAAAAAKGAFGPGPTGPGEAPRHPAPRRRPDRGARRRDRRGRVRRHRPADPVHVQAAARAENFRFFADIAPDARNGLTCRPTTTSTDDARPDRPGRRDHAVEHTVHAVDVEDRAGAGGRLHRGAQAGRVEPVDRATCWPRSRSRPACRPACSTWCTAWARRPARR